MTKATGSAVLDAIISSTRIRIKRLRSMTSISTFLRTGTRFPRRSLLAALRAQTPAIIAEVKKASPSKGLFRADFDPVQRARDYVFGGAVAISVVTEPEHFAGDDGWLEAIRNAVPVPLLRKDFVLDPIQVAEAAALGADAILVIARLLSVEQMQVIASVAADATLDILYEAHDESDLAKITVANARIVGINARNLEDFTVDTGLFARLRPLIAAGATLVAESGIETMAQVRECVRLGYHACLIGETLVRADDPAAMLSRLLDKDTRSVPS
ncbi:MAG: indole-3-glycerol-phosphate synthase [candidate division Zixibacteria bacterium]|nr:indole-3-glycerol-phosphate synthase [candidate division Zixibacteria bacterium]